MKKNRIMLLGAVGAGKTTLLKKLTNKNNLVTKTQSIEYTINTIDTPGEFLENPFYHKALFATSLETDVILFLLDGTKKNSGFPPGFPQAFSKKTFGVITKIDDPNADVKQAQLILENLGFLKKTFPVSAVTGVGIGDLKKALEWE